MIKKQKTIDVPELHQRLSEHLKDTDLAWKMIGVQNQYLIAIGIIGETNWGLGFSSVEEVEPYRVSHNLARDRIYSDKAFVKVLERELGIPLSTAETFPQIEAQYLVELGIA